MIRCTFHPETPGDGQAMFLDDAGSADQVRARLASRALHRRGPSPGDDERLTAEEARLRLSSAVWGARAKAMGASEGRADVLHNMIACSTAAFAVGALVRNSR